MDPTKPQAEAEGECTPGVLRRMLCVFSLSDAWFASFPRQHITYEFRRELSGDHALKVYFQQDPLTKTYQCLLGTTDDQPCTTKTCRPIRAKAHIRAHFKWRDFTCPGGFHGYGATQWCDLAARPGIFN